MTPISPTARPFGFWRLDDRRFSATWDSGVGARLSGGRWNPQGMATVYCSVDPGVAILEVAVHKGFETLNAVPHVLSNGEISLEDADVHIVEPALVPNKLWLYPCATSAAQQAFGGKLLSGHDFVLFPSAVSRHSWNLLFNPERAAGKYVLKLQESLDLDPRLNPPRTTTPRSR